MAHEKRWPILMCAVLIACAILTVRWEYNWLSSIQLQEQQQAQLQLMQESLQRLEDQEKRVTLLLERQANHESSSSSSSSSLAQAELSLDLIDESPEFQWLYVKHENNPKLERVDVPDLVRQLKQSGANLELSEPSKRLLVVLPFFNGSAQRWPEVSATIPYYRRYLSLFKIPFEILFAEQAQTGLLFNKGTVYNAAFIEYMDSFDYMLLADIDSFPVFYRSGDGKFKWVPLGYPSGDAPYHLAREVEKEGWRFMTWYAGVALMFKREQFEAVNGFSNNYYSWGSEDDDVQARVQRKFGAIRRYGEHEGMFHSQPHQIIHERCENNNNPRNRAWAADLLSGGHKMEDDGVRQAKYEIVHKGWTNRWGGFHWLRIIPTTPLMGNQVNRVPQHEIDECKAKGKA